MKEVEYIEEDVKKVIATGELPLDGIRLSDEEQKNRIFDMLEKDGYILGDRTDLEIGYDGANSFEDGMVTNFIVTRKVKEKVPYEVSKEEMFNGSFSFDETVTEADIREKVFSLLDFTGMEYDATDDFEISYNMVNDSSLIEFRVSKIIKNRLDNRSDLEEFIPEEVIVQEVELEDIVNGTINVKGLTSQEEIDKKVVDLLNTSGVEIDKMGELNLVYGDVTEEGSMPFTVSKVLIENVKYRIDRELIGKGFVDSNEDVFALVQRQYGLDVRNDPNYEIICDSINEYKLVKVNRTRLGVVADYLSQKESIDETIETPEKDEESIESKEQLALLNSSIESLQEQLDAGTADYETTLAKMQSLMNAEFEMLESQGILTNEELIDFKEKYVQEKLAENSKAISLKKELQLLQRRLAELVQQKSKVYDNSLSTSYSNSSILDEINSLYGIENQEMSQQGLRKIQVGENALRLVDNNSASLPEKIVSTRNNLDNNYVPLEAPADMKEVMEARQAEKVVSEKFVIYKDLSEENSYYARANVFTRFNAKKLGEEVKIANASYYKLAKEDLDFIRRNANNGYSPYTIDDREINLGKTTFLSDVSSKNELSGDLGEIKSDALEKISIYVDLNDNGARYVRKNVFERFNAKKIGEEVRINNAVCYKISEEDSGFIIANASNEYSPYTVEMCDVHLKDKVGTTDENNNPNQKNEENNETVKHETIIIYRDINDNNQLYVGAAILNKFGIKPTGKMTKIKGKNCYKIDDVIEDKINQIALESKNPKYTVKYVDVKVKKKAKKTEGKQDDDNDFDDITPVPHVEAIIDKLTNDLDIRKSDCKNFKFKNIKASEILKSELKSGNVWYNVVHFVPTLGKTTFTFLRKLGSSLMSTERGQKSMAELNRRLNEELSTQELEVLFNEYRGSQLKTDMNNQINELVLDKLREYGLTKVENMNQNIKDAYSQLFSLIGQIRVIENAFQEENVDDKLKEELRKERKELVDKAASYVKIILVNRKDANNLLSGGVHGLEEDFKAVATKLSYVGMRFGKSNDFDNELQHILGKYGQGLNDALAKKDNEAIVNNFMGLESCYYDNTEIAKSIFGKRSVGDKYYSPLAEQFDYRDDPFIRDMFTSVTMLSAIASAANAVRIHQIKSHELLKNQQQDAVNVNSANDSIMDYVHQTGKDIEERRATFQEGMKAQANQDVLNSANAIERAELDMHNWSFGDAYRAADSQGHAFFNGFHKNVVGEINDITAKYGTGEITQVEALQNLAGVANNAQTTLNNVSKECLNILNDYTKTHPSFDLSGVKETLDYVVANPDAIVNMNNAMVDVTNLAGGLQGLSINHLEVLESLPSDMSSTLICAATATSLALNVSRMMKKKKNNKAEYGNEIIDMMDEYLSMQADDEEEIKNRK